ncbi:unnamed protein product [Citrullus colocynthis]|uniref:Uncharacterized protein n=1 Tax=Citrullus colocynthis TaxID=252529 RepID=A0ABP0Z0L2_9ROSI
MIFSIFSYLTHDLQHNSRRLTQPHARWRSIITPCCGARSQSLQHPTFSCSEFLFHHAVVDQSLDPCIAGHHKPKPHAQPLKFVFFVGFLEATISSSALKLTPSIFDQHRD